MLQGLLGDAADVIGGGRQDQRKPLQLIGRDLVRVFAGVACVGPGRDQIKCPGNDQQKLFQGQIHRSVLISRRHTADHNIRIISL